MMKYNEEAAYNFGLTLEDIYVLEKIEDFILNTTISKDGDRGEFTFNQVDLFKICKFVFKQVDECENEEEIKKIYKTNNARFNKMLKGALGKILVKCSTIKLKGKSETYYKINKEIRTILINGYPKVVDLELSEIEKLVVDELKMKTIGKNIRTQLKSMNIDKLKVAISIAKEHNILDYPYVKSIYNNLDSNVKKPQESANSQGSSDNKSIDLHSNTNSIPQIYDSINNFESKNNNHTKNVNNENEDAREKIIAKQKQDYEMISRKNKFHNTNASFINYTPDELERHLQESQKGKFK